MPPLDLALSLRMIRCTADVLHTLFFEPVSQVACNIRRAIVAEQSRPMHDGGAVEARCRQCLVQCSRDAPGAHRGPESPAHDVARSRRAPSTDSTSPSR